MWIIWAFALYWMLPHQIAFLNGGTCINGWILSGHQQAGFFFSPSFVMSHERLAII
jgi:hypothetical protein